MLYENIDTLIKEAMRNQDAKRLSTLRLIKTELTNSSHADGVVEFTEEMEQATLKSMVKARTKAIEEYIKAGREDLASEEEEEMVIIKEFLPKEPTEDELRAHIREVISAYNSEMLANNPGFKLSMKDMSPIVSRVKETYDFQVVGKLTSEVLKTLI